MELHVLNIKTKCCILQRDHKIYTLDVSGNEIGAIGVMYVGEMMVENTTITELVSMSYRYRGDCVLWKIKVLSKHLHYDCFTFLLPTF